MCCGASAVTGIRTEGEGRGAEAVAFHCIDPNVKVKVSASLSRESFNLLLAASEASSGLRKLTEMFVNKIITSRQIIKKVVWGSSFSSVLYSGVWER